MPADVIWRSPRCDTSVFPIESPLITGRRYSTEEVRNGVLLKPSIDNVRKHLELAVSMSSEPGAKLDPIPIQDSLQARCLINHAIITIVS